MESAAHVSVLVGCLDSLPSVASFVWNIQKAFLNIGHKPWLSVYNLSWWPPALRPILSESPAALSDHSAPQQSHNLLLARERLQQQTPRRRFLCATKTAKIKHFSRLPAGPSWTQVVFVLLLKKALSSYSSSPSSSPPPTASISLRAS